MHTLRNIILRLETARSNNKAKEKFGDFLATYFREKYDGSLFKKWKAIIFETDLYYEDDLVGGWSSMYCRLTWNDRTLENEADLEIFDLLLKIDIKNGADSSKVVHSLCTDGAFEAVKVTYRC